MNALAQPAAFVPHRFTIDDVWSMVQSGILEEAARVELIDGALIDMPDDGPLHIDWSVALGAWLHRNLDPSRYSVVPGSTLVLSEENAPKPDWYVFAAELRTASVRGDDVLLAIEQANTSLRRDLRDKSDLYARFGVRDYWVIDLQGRRLHVHRGPSSEGYQSKAVVEADQTADALLISALSIRLDALPRVGTARP